MRNIIALLLGSLFAVGLLMSGMANPQKVLNFLDVFGNWDASLAFVMLGAILVAFLPFQYALRKPQTITHEPIELPRNTSIDRRLIIGSMLFGMGWGIAGICPAPALTLIGLGYSDGLYFVVAMLAGMLLYRYFSGVR
ncbi:MAG: YeeE/YedE family protein [Moraxellaceae bacterium]|nr:MAG: YeeE/YedE family protein [Moraxellaceae bacterium]